MMETEFSMSKKLTNQSLESIKPLEDLLRNIGIFLKLREKANAGTRGKDFTVFTALGNENNEVNTHSRFLYEILRPDGFHGMGAVFLKEFFKNVLSVDVPENLVNFEFDKERVFKKNINNNDKGGRIDLYIETQDYAYPIEVKIGKGDQPSQIKRYYDYADKERKKKTIVFYLTLDGHSPSQDSQGDVPDDKVLCISFKKEIRDWLLKCEDISRHSSSVAGAIRQYITLIEKLTESKENIYMDAIQELISSSPQNYRSALVAANNLPYVRAKLMKRILDDLYLHFTKDERIGKLNRYETDNDKNIEKYYNIQKVKDWDSPCISFVIKHFGETTVEITFEFTINEGFFYYGISTNGPICDKLDDDKDSLISAYKDNNWKKYAEKAVKNGDSPWIWWKRLPSREKEANFCSCNDENYLKLYEENGYKEFITAITEEIEANLDNILSNGVPKDTDNVKFWQDIT